MEVVLGDVLELHGLLLLLLLIGYLFFYFVVRFEVNFISSSKFLHFERGLFFYRSGGLLDLIFFYKGV